MSTPIKSSRIKEYFRFKAKINARSVIDLLKTLPNSDFNEPHEGQRLVIDAYDERIAPTETALKEGLDFEYKYRTLTVCAGRRWGKSVISSVLGLTELLVPNSQVMILAPALSNTEVIFNKIHRFLTLLGIGMKSERVRDMELILENNSTLRVASVENAASRLGLNISLLIVDEMKLVPRNLIQQTLLPMLFDMAPLSRVVYISSPAPGFLETMYNYGQSDDPKWKSYWSLNSPTYMNPTIPTAELDEWRKTMPPDVYSTEVLGLFTSTEGRVFSEFDRKLNVFDINDYPHFGDWLQHNVIIQSIDSGFKHFFASVWFCYVEEQDTIFVFEEYNLNNTITSVHAENMKDIEQRWCIEPEIRFADPAAAQQICDFQDYDLYFSKADKNTRETINQVNSLFYQRSEITGLPKLLISKDCAELLRQIAEVSWKVGRDELTKENSAAGVKPFQPDRSGAKTDFDLVDALRYGIFSYAKNNMLGVSVMSFLGNGEVNDEEEEDAMTVAMQSQGFFKVK
jgi:hypothetical protein